MRFVTSLPPVANGPNTSQVGGVARVQAVKPLQTGDQAVPIVQNRSPRQEPAPAVMHRQHSGPFEDRRKACRRLSQQPVLVELRSGVERRRHNLRADDLVDHIDETA
jgi:hypothetical protein